MARNDSSVEYCCLREGASGSALFCIYGVELYRPLADALLVDIPVHGIYVEEIVDPNRDRSTWRHFDPVARMAYYVDRYVEEVRLRQPEGPYWLCGASFGGMVALEVARQLEHQGAEVAFLGMFDVVAPGRTPQLRIDQKLRMHWRLMRRQGWGYFRERIIDRLRRATRERPSPNREIDARHRLTEARVDAREFMMAAYHPAPYDGEVHLFRAEEYDLFDARCWEYDMGWSRLIDRLHIHDIAGDHISILKPGNVEAIARIISDCLPQSGKTA